VNFILPNRLLHSIKRLTRRFGFDIVSSHWMDPDTGLTIDFDPVTIETIRKVKPFTMTSPERVFTLCRAVEYIVMNKIPGAVVECGVWKGGSIMAAIMTLMRLDEVSRDIYLYDSFDEMPPPTSADTYRGVSCIELARKSGGTDTFSTWGWHPATLAEVQKAVYSLNYPRDRIHFVTGLVEDTLPAQSPPTIALLRLDTDFYQSTLHELIHLYPLLSSGGVLIIDDYGHADGARLAVDQYITQHQLCLLLNRIDYTGRIAIKP
jgi:hypothetical protein